MIKHNFFVKFLKKINLSINNLLKKYLNKLNIINLPNIAKSHKVLLTFVVLVIFFLSYLSIPNIYNKNEVKKKLENQFSDAYGLRLVITQNIKYKFFPRPHFIAESSFISKNKLKITDIKKLRVYISLKNLFSLKNISINKVILENTNFNLDKSNYKFFINLLNNDYSKSNLIIKKSNIFFRNINKEVLFINKIKYMKYYFDSKELKNIFISENELFNISYSLLSYRNKKKEIYSEINFDSLNFQIKNFLDYNEDLKKGEANFIYKQNKNIINYDFNSKFFNFIYTDKINSKNFYYNGNINFNPFFSKLNGKVNKINLINLFNQEAFFVQLLKTEILNNTNLNFNLNIKADKILQNKNFVNIILNSKIHEGLIDVDKTKFSWKNHANFNLSNSLIYLDENQLFLDGKLIIDIFDVNEIYKFLLTPKKYRLGIKKIELNINYNFDKKTINLADIMIDGKTDNDVNEVLKNIIFKKDNLQNKVHIKKILNAAIKSYAG